MGPPSPSWASAIPGLWTGAQGTRLPRRVFGAGQDVPTPGVRAHPLGSPVPEPQGHRTHRGGVPAPGGGRAMPGRLGLAHGADAAGTKWTPRGPSLRGAGGQGEAPTHSLWALAPRDRGPRSLPDPAPAAASASPSCPFPGDGDSNGHQAPTPAGLQAHEFPRGPWPSLNHTALQERCELRPQRCGRAVPGGAHEEAATSPVFIVNRICLHLALPPGQSRVTGGGAPGGRAVSSLRLCSPRPSADRSRH